MSNPLNQVRKSLGRSKHMKTAQAQDFDRQQRVVLTISTHKLNVYAHKLQFTYSPQIFLILLLMEVWNTFSIL